MENLLSIGTVHALFAALFLMTKRAQTLSDTLLASWMVFLALPLMGGATALLWPGVKLPLLGADLIYPLTYGPFMWLYVRSLAGDIDRIRPRHLVHFLPFAATALVQMTTAWAPPPPNPEVAVFSASVRIIGGINLALLLAYTFAVFWRLRRHDREIGEHFSELPTRISLGWLRWLTAGVTVVFLLLFLAALLSMPALLGVHLAALVASILGLSLFGLRQDRVFAPRDMKERPRAVASPGSALAPRQPIRMKQRYDRSGLTGARADIIAARLEDFMRSDRPYLDPDLTIETVARRIGVPRHHLTEVINERHEKNFYLFVNQYRIEEAQQALKDPSQAGRTVLDIAYASGFNSKSPFNSAFKKLTGMTPSQYRRELS